MRRHTHTDIPQLLEQEKDARSRASAALRELLTIYGALDAVGKEADRKSYNDSRYRRARWQFTAFLNSLRGNKRLLMSALGALEGISASSFVSPEDLIAQIQGEDDAKEARKQRRASRTGNRGAVNA